MRLALVYEHSFKHSRFLCCSIPSFGVSATSPSSFNMSQPSAIIFIKCRNPHHMKNNIRYKGNINNTSVIIFLIEGQKLPVMLLCLGEPPVRFWLYLFIHFCSSFCCCCFSFISRLFYHVTGAPPWLLRPVKTSNSSALYPDYF